MRIEFPRTFGLKHQALTVGAFFVALLAPLAAHAQVVSTFAGSGAQGSADGLGTAATFHLPAGVAVDASGNVYVGDTLNNKIRKITPAGIVSTFAGSGAQGSADGPGTTASFFYPWGVAVDVSGNVYVADAGNNKIRKITPAGIVSTFAGSGVVGSTDGPAATASFNDPRSVAVDASGNVYVADYISNKIRKIYYLSGSYWVSTFAGTGAFGSADGPGGSATFSLPSGVAVDVSGNLYVADTDDNKVRKITPAGVVSTFAGSGAQGSADGAGTTASFYYPWDVAVDVSGNPFVTDNKNNKIRKITPGGVVTTYAGTGYPGSADGPGTTAMFNSPFGVAVDGSGNVYVADSNNNKIRKITVTSGCTLTLSPATLPGGVVGTAYSQTILASGGSSPYTFSLSSGSLPPGFSLSPSGVLSGTPTTPGMFSFTISARDASTYCTGSASYSITISSACTAPNLPVLTSDKSQVVSGDGNVVTFNWSQVLSATGDNYRLEVADHGLGNFQALATLNWSSTSYGVQFSTPRQGLFDFHVVAHRACGLESVSNIVVITVLGPCTPPAAPTVYAVSSAKPNQTGLTANVANHAGSTYYWTVTNGTLTSGQGTNAIVFTGGASGSIGLSVTETNGGCTSAAGTTSIPIDSCVAPLAPINPSIAAKGSPAGVVPGGTDFLVLGWQAAASGQAPSQYQYRLNGDALTATSSTTAEANPRKSNDSITLTVQALACTPTLTSPAATSATVSPASPSASFSIDKPTVAPNTNVTLTDTSSPQATSWLWLFSGGIGPMTTQSPKVQFTAAGTYQVALVVSNGAGSSVSNLQTITVTSAASLAPAPAVSLSRFDAAGEGRLVLGRAELGGEGRTYVLIRNLSADEEALAFLRAVDVDGRVVVERRLVIPANDEAIYDAGAWGLEGQLHLELVSTTPLTAYLQTEHTAKPQGPRLPQER